jgi:hypothetical protein
MTYVDAGRRLLSYGHMIDIHIVLALRGLNRHGKQSENVRS